MLKIILTLLLIGISINIKAGFLYTQTWSSPTSINVFDLNAGGTLVNSYSLGYGNDGEIALRENGHLYATGYGVADFTVLDVSTGNQIKTVANHGASDSFTFGHDDNIYAMGWGDTSIYVINPDSGSLIRTFDSYSFSGSMVFGDDGLLYASDDDDTNLVRVFDPVSGLLVRSFNNLDSGNTLAFGQDGLLYSSGWEVDAVFGFDPISGALLNRIDMQHNVGGIAFDSNGFLYVEDDEASDYIRVYDPESGALINSFSALGAGSTLVIPQVPLPASVWLFGSALIGLIGRKHLSRKVA